MDLNVQLTNAFNINVFSEIIFSVFYIFIND